MMESLRERPARLGSFEVKGAEYLQIFFLRLMIKEKNEFEEAEID